jgi:HlyD family secretion protein
MTRRPERDEAQAAYVNGVALAEAGVAEARAALTKAAVELDRTKIRAPREGQVLRILTNPGEQVGTNGICELGETRRLYVVADVYEADVGLVRKGQRVSVTGRALTKQLAGTVESVGLLTGKREMEGIDPANPRGSRIISVHVLLDPIADPPPAIGTEVRVDIAFDPAPEAMVRISDR